MTRTMDGLVRTRAIGAGILVGATITAGLAFTSVAAAQVPNCGGNNDIKISPVLCQNTRTIDGTAFTVVLEVTADGAITASYSLAAPRAVDTPIRMRAHRGISSNTEVNEAAAHHPGWGDQRHADQPDPLRADRHEGGLHRQRRCPGPRRGAVRHHRLGLCHDPDHVHAAIDGAAGHHHRGADDRAHGRRNDTDVGRAAGDHGRLQQRDPACHRFRCGLGRSERAARGRRRGVGHQEPPAGRHSRLTDAGGRPGRA